MTWQPIATAPKDGTPILGWDGQDLAAVYWYSYQMITGEDQGYWSLTVAGAFAEDSEWTPTHWHTLPASPQTAPVLDHTET